MNQPAGLISVLLDKNSDVASRDDAAMDLGEYDGPDVEYALYLSASSKETPEVVCCSSGESLAYIWARRGEINRKYYQELRESAKRELDAIIREKFPDLLSF